MTLTFEKSKNCYLINNKIIIDVEESLKINKLKNLNNTSFTFDEDKLIWIYNNYKSKTPLIKILFPDDKIKSFEFKNGDINDYRQDNLLIKYDERFNDDFKQPVDYTILYEGTAHKITEGKFAGQYRNMYWKVQDRNKNTYYMMHIKDDIYTKISKRDLNKVLDYESIRPIWYVHPNGYIATTLRINEKCKQYYLHQVIMDVHDEDLTNFEKTVDHINQDKLDNRRENLRLVSMAVQNANRDKPERRKDACELPAGLTQTDLPKYVVYRKEQLDENKYREYFYIENHPKLENRWETTKSNKVGIREKLKLAKLKLQQLDDIITEQEYKKETGETNKLDLPTFIQLVHNRDKAQFVFDKKTEDTRYNLKMVLKSTDIQTELNKFIDTINKKYPELNMEKYEIKNKIKIKENQVSTELKLNTEIKLKLPSNFSFYKDAKYGYHFGYNKSIKGERYSIKIRLTTNDIQKEFDTFINLVNTKYSDLKINKYQIPNIPKAFKIFETKE